MEDKHVIYHFKARDLEITNIYILVRKIFKSRDFKKALMNFAKSIIAHIFAIVEQTISSDSPDRVLQNDTQYV